MYKVQSTLFFLVYLLMLQINIYIILSVSPSFESTCMLCWPGSTVWVLKHLHSMCAHPELLDASAVISIIERFTENTEPCVPTMPLWEQQRDWIMKFEFIQIHKCSGKKNPIEIMINRCGPAPPVCVHMYSVNLLEGADTSHTCVIAPTRDNVTVAGSSKHCPMTCHCTSDSLIL